MQSKSAFSFLELGFYFLIIFVLMGAVFAGSKMLYTSKLAQARNLTDGSPVASIRDLILWFDTTSEKSFPLIPANSTAVSAWPNINPQYSSGMSLSNATSGKQPLYIKKGLNGLPVLRFDGVDDYLASDNLASAALPLSNEITIFLVGKIYSGTVLLNYQSSAANRISLELNGNALRSDLFNDSSGRLIGVAAINNRDIILTVVKNTNTQSIYLNSVLDSTKTNSDSLDPFTAQIYLGSYPGGILPTRLDISEFIVFSRHLSAFERRQIEEYLSKKWRIRLS